MSQAYSNAHVEMCKIRPYDTIYAEVVEIKLLSFVHKQKHCYGVVVEKGVIDLTKKVNDKYEDLKAFLEHNGPQSKEIHDIMEKWDVDCQLSDISFLPVIPNPDKIICVGLNYVEHINETQLKATEKPLLFVRFTQSQLGHKEAILRPIESEKVDYEGEIAVIIGREGRRIPKNKANDYIAGYACYNDVSIRDWQSHSSQFTPGKNFDGTGAFGPWMVTRDEIADSEILTLETRLNGQVVQSATSQLMIFTIPDLIHYISAFTTLLPGDVIVTGTPGGVGYMRKPPLFLKAGDVVEVEVSKIGVLINTVQDG